MTDIREKAASTSHEVRLPTEQEGQSGEILSAELVSADEISPEGDFPEYGDFLWVENSTTGSEEYWLCPVGFAAEIVDVDEEVDEVVGRLVIVEDTTKTDGGWQYTVTVKSQ